MNGHRELQHLAVDSAQPHQVGQLIDVVAQKGCLALPVTLPLRLMVQLAQFGLDGLLVEIA